MYGSRPQSRINKNHFEQNFEQSSANISQSNYNDSRLYNQNDQSYNNPDGQAILLLGIKSNGDIQLNSDALDIIASYNDKPVGFVALVGKYRTGKSFLLNKLMMLQKNGFKVQKYTSACTQGIWMWNSPFLNTDNQSYLFFVDTQGLASMEKGQRNDVRILTMATLISSYLIYNSVGCIDERSISDLSAITKLSQNILAQKSVSQQQNEKRLKQFMPKFCWVLRDFTLQLKDQRGRQITPKQYLQNSLREDNSVGKLKDDTRKVKKSLLSYFPDRDCLTLVRPARQQSEIQQLYKLPDISLRRQFIDGVNALRQKIQRNFSCKRFQGNQLNGNDMACLIQTFAEAINNGEIPEIKSAWQQIANNQGDIAYEKGHQKYKQLFEKYFGNQEPKNEKDLYELLSSMKQQAQNQFRLHLSDQNGDHMKKLKSWIKQQSQLIIQANTFAIGQKNLQILKAQSQGLMKRVESNYYVGKKQEYLKDLSETLKNYRSKAIGQKQKQALLAQFLQTTNKIGVNLQRQPQNYEDNGYLKKQNDQRMRIEQQRIKAKINQARIQQNLKQNKTAKQEKRNKNKKETKEAEQKVGCCGTKKCQIM